MQILPISYLNRIDFTCDGIRLIDSIDALAFKTEDIATCIF